MRRLLVANLLVFAVLASAAALAYYGWSYTAEMSSRERELVLATMRELAFEKMVNIERTVTEPERKVFEAIRLDQPREFAEIIKRENPPVKSVIVLDADLQVVGSGYHTTRADDEASKFLDRFMREILPTLPLRQQPLRERGHRHDEQYLFAFFHGSDLGRDFYVVFETDLDYLLLTVFPVILGVSSPYLYEVVDDNGTHRYGPEFRSEGPVILLPFSETVDRWRVRVGQRNPVAQSARGRRKAIDIILIGLALGGIVAGLSVLLLAMHRERKANELKSDFISNVSHELKTPLSIISMFGEMLALGRVKTPDQATEYAEIIWRESVRLARLIDNVLDFAKIERGKDVYEFAEGADVAEIIGRAIELSQHRLQKAGITVETDIAADVPRARIDTNALTLAVMNLIDNAIKYASDGKRLVIRLRRPGDRIVLEVEDFGPGIDPAEHDRIFERFYRARAVRLKPIRGSGIGLALVDHIARAHHGGVWVDSRLGGGATFGLWIPVGGAAAVTSVV